MADSFFGFNTTLPMDDDGGGEDGHEDEDEYDALNDETFGDAINGDWEGMHENLVRLDEFRFDSVSGDLKSNSDHDSDLEINLARVGLEDCDVSHDDSEGRLQLDPSVWSSPSKSLIPQKKNSNDLYGLYGNPELFLRQNFSQPFNNFPQQPLHGPQHHNNMIGKIPHSGQISHMTQCAGASSSNKIVTVQDIERNIRNQAHQTKAPLPNSIPKPMMSLQDNMIHSPMANHMMQQQMHGSHGLPSTMHSSSQQPARPQMFHTHPGQNLSQQQMQQASNRFPPGFSPLHLMGAPPSSNSQAIQQPPQMPLILNRNLPQNLPPMPMMQHMHTNYGAIRSASNHAMAQMPSQQKHMHVQPQQQQQSQQQLPSLPLQQVPPRMPQHLVSQHFPQNLQNLQNSVNQNLQNSVNQFNKRLVQEIQQNHPLLAQLNRGTNITTSNNNNSYASSVYVSGNNVSNNGNNHKNNSQLIQNRHDRNFTEYDEYSNLMSTRDKQWLLGIQLMQLNTETPYIDDFYFTVYKERQKQNKGEFESKAHKDNTLNHPLTQPKGHHHAQLLMMLGKSGTNHQRNGMNNRERKISENSNKNQSDKDLSQRTYTLLQFENSLGKLQCGSVTAPRKIIDMDIVGPEIINTFNTTNEISAQRRSRQLLLHIETLYKIVLKMEDLQNPIAIEAALIMKEKKDKEKQMAGPAMLAHLTNDGESECGAGGDSANESLNSSISSSERNEPETFTELLPKLLAGLTSDKVTAMMTVRKGKNLLRRIMPLIRDQIQKWDIWCDIISTLSVIVKKDRDDVDGLLINFYPEFRKQIQYAGMDDIIRIISSLQYTDPKQQKSLNIDSKRIQYIIESKFCILLVISIILRIEQFYTISDALVNEEQKQLWLLFVNLLSNCSKFNDNNNAQQPLLSNNEILKTITNHFSRFTELKSSQNLLNFLSQNELLK